MTNVTITVNSKWCSDWIVITIANDMLGLNNYPTELM